MQIKSQGNYRTSKILKMSQALPDEQALYRIGCLKGTTGAVRVVMPIHDEGIDTICRLLQAELSDEEIATIKTFSVDNATPKLEVALGQLCLNFQGLIQDNSHLLIRYRQAFWGKKSPGAALLQQILSKFNRFSDTNGIGGRTGGIIRYFKSSDTLRVSVSGKKYVDRILDAMMPIASSLSYVQSMDFDRPFVNRLTFVKMIAALTSLYPKETKRTVPPGPLTIRQVLQKWVSARECGVQAEPHTAATLGGREVTRVHREWHDLNRSSPQRIEQPLVPQHANSVPEHRAAKDPDVPIRKAVGSPQNDVCHNEQVV